MNKVQKWKSQQILLIEYLIENPGATRAEMAEISDVTKGTVVGWLKDPVFVEAFYDRYMVSFGAKLPSVLNAMVREALEGNVQAGRLVLEHSGKLVKNVHIKHESPFEKFIAAEVMNDATDAEFSDVICEEITKEDFKSLPERNPKNSSPRKRVLHEAKRVKNIKKHESDKKRQRENYELRTRAKKVGLEPLRGGRPNKYIRKRWLKELEKREASLRPSPQT
tara:strand:- start:546 stop:1211 length:666 start_codon:yes stop_codon:yes gene_type:complete